MVVPVDVPVWLDEPVPVLVELAVRELEPVWLEELVPVLVGLEVRELLLVWLDELVPVLVGLVVRELELVWLEELVPVLVWLGLGVQEGCRYEVGSGRKEEGGWLGLGPTKKVGDKVRSIQRSSKEKTQSPPPPPPPRPSPAHNSPSWSRAPRRR